MAWADVDFSIEGRPYRLVTTPRSWAAAEADAVAQGGHLAHVDSGEENAELVTSMAQSGAVWLGGLELATEGTYAWVDAPTQPFWNGAAVGYANWSGSGPDDSNGSQSRVAMVASGQWEDHAATDELPYIIEFDGMWAQFRMQHGSAAPVSFTTKLFFEKAPITVANFVNLAEGRQTFVDEKAGLVVQRPFYNGLTCHRIIAGFMLQGGCPRGNGTSGPGYKFPDEFDLSLTHAPVGMLSMANSGNDSNGSQFFVTVAATTHLDFKHSIFGQVVHNYASVVLPLSQVATGNSPSGQPNYPLLPVVIQSVTIHRAGVPARTFQPPMPSLSLIPLQPLVQNTRDVVLQFPSQPFTGYDLMQTGNLQTWSLRELGNFGATPSTNQIFASSFTAAGTPKQFYRMAQITSPYVGQASLAGKRITLTSYQLAPTMLQLDLPETGTTGRFTVSQPSANFSASGDITSYTWSRDIWGGYLQAAIPDGALVYRGSTIRFLGAQLRPATKLGRGSLLLANPAQGFSVPGNSLLSISPLP
jgi:cyclophilin family peptidyl-prolyl cis-trans isomerase